MTDSFNWCKGQFKYDRSQICSAKGHYNPDNFVVSKTFNTLC